jgi:hypothetical protein
MARLTAGVAVLGPALFWIFDRPLCGFVGVDRAVPGSAACPPVIPQFLLTTQTLATAIVVGLSVLIVVRLLGRLQVDDAVDVGWSDGGGIGTIAARAGWAEVSASTRTLLLLLATAAGAILLTVLIRAALPDTNLLVWDRIPVEPVALILSIPAVLIAVFVATARDARRFVMGAIVAIVAWFVVVYPNISALPLPTSIANVYQGVLPTYLYAFQFPVSTIPRNTTVQLLSPVPLLLAASVIFLSVIVAYSAWVWRLTLAERMADERDGTELGPGADPGGHAAGD